VIRFSHVQTCFVGRMSRARGDMNGDLCHLVIKYEANDMDKKDMYKKYKALIYTYH